jgi:hypothetical protein
VNAIQFISKNGWRLPENIQILWDEGKREEALRTYQSNVATQRLATRLTIFRAHMVPEIPFSYEEHVIIESIGEGYFYQTLSEATIRLIYRLWSNDNSRFLILDHRLLQAGEKYNCIPLNERVPLARKIILPFNGYDPEQETL